MYSDLETALVRHLAPQTLLMTHFLYPYVNPLLAALAITVMITLWLLSPPASLAPTTVSFALGAFTLVDVVLTYAVLYYWPWLKVRTTTFFLPL